MEHVINLISNVLSNGKVIQVFKLRRKIWKGNYR